MKEYTKPKGHKHSTVWQCPCTIRLPRTSLSSQSLGKHQQVNQNNQETQHIQMQTNDTEKVALVNSAKEHTYKNQETDRARFICLL